MIIIDRRHEWYAKNGVERYYQFWDGREVERGYRIRTHKTVSVQQKPLSQYRCLTPLPDYLLRNASALSPTCPTRI